MHLFVYFKKTSSQQSDASKKNKDITPTKKMWGNVSRPKKSFLTFNHMLFGVYGIRCALQEKNLSNYIDIRWDKLWAYPNLQGNEI